MGSAVQSLVYRTTLACVLFCPLATWGLGQAGVAGWSVKLPEGFTYERVELPPSTAPNSIAVESNLAKSPLPATDVDANLELGPTQIEIPRAVLPVILSNADGQRGSPVATAPTKQPIPILPAGGEETTIEPAANHWAFDISQFGLISPFMLIAWIATHRNGGGRSL